jgi:hypothetical protein
MSDRALPLDRFDSIAMTRYKKACRQFATAGSCVCGKDPAGILDATLPILD